jgi:hypothetical protein
MMESVREAWTDERLADLNHRVDGGFKEMRTEFRAFRGELSAQQRMMVQLFGGMFATMIVGFLGTIAAVISQH